MCGGEVSRRSPRVVPRGQTIMPLPIPGTILLVGGPVYNGRGFAAAETYVGQILKRAKPPICRSCGCVGWATALRRCPPVHFSGEKNDGHASLCPSYANGGKRIATRVSRRRLQQLLHLGPGIGREVRKRRPVLLRHAIEDRRLDRGPRAHARPPVRDRGIVRPQAIEA